MLSMGASRPWPDAMEVMTGQRELDAGALLEYFKPLEDWLVQTNAALGVNVGWRPSDSKQTLAAVALHRLAFLVFFRNRLLNAVRSRFGQLSQLLVRTHNGTIKSPKEREISKQ
jgi:Angiotensin-converting enzyme